MDTSGTVGRGGNHLCYRQPAVDQREQLNSPGASGRVPEFPASADVVTVDGGTSQLGISRRENVSGRLAGGSKLLAVPPRCAVRSVAKRLYLVPLSSFWVVEQFLLGLAGNFTHNPIDHTAKTNDHHKTNNEKHK